MRYGNKWRSVFFIILPAGAILLAVVLASGLSSTQPNKTSDHFDGKFYFNPTPLSSQSSEPQRQTRGFFSFALRWFIGTDRPEWPPPENLSPGPRPEPIVSGGTIRITPVGHSTFLIQMHGLNLLTDPIWSDRCSPVSWAGPKRHKPPGILLEDLPPINAILISHNHYDHLDRTTLQHLADKGITHALAPLGNRKLIQETGIRDVTELDWWQSISLSKDVKVTFVPAQHFSSRTPWDRNETLWGGFVISGPAGNIYYAGDTGYGAHFKEIARRFPTIRVALLPISPFRPQQSKTEHPPHFTSVHMGPAEAVQAHTDLGTKLSIAAHFQVFQLGWDGFDDALNELSANIKKNTLAPDDFLTPTPGTPIELRTLLAIENNPSGKTTRAPSRHITVVRISDGH
jgi:L-ascorbate metabolism protein UlaG (beta-lactamase superfamily)